MDDTETEQGHQVSRGIKPPVMLKELDTALGMLDHQATKFLEIWSLEETVLQQWGQMLHNSHVILDTVRRSARLPYRRHNQYAL